MADVTQGPLGSKDNTAGQRMDDRPRSFWNRPGPSGLGATPLPEAARLADGLTPRDSIAYFVYPPHGHTPCRQWDKIRDDPNSPGASTESLLALLYATTPAKLVPFARLHLKGYPLAVAHFDYYLAGSGKWYDEDAALQVGLLKDQGIINVVARAIASEMVRTGKKDVDTGVVRGRTVVYQNDYANQDLRNSFGTLNRLEFEADFQTKQLAGWFLDRYEWNPYYPGLYSVHDGDFARSTNFVHAAMVEMKDQGAQDFWMRGYARVPLAPFLFCI